MLCSCFPTSTQFYFEYCGVLVNCWWLNILMCISKRDVAHTNMKLWWKVLIQSNIMENVWRANRSWNLGSVSPFLCLFQCVSVSGCLCWWLWRKGSQTEKCVCVWSNGLSGDPLYRSASHAHVKTNMRSMLVHGDVVNVHTSKERNVVGCQLFAVHLLCVLRATFVHARARQWTVDVTFSVQAGKIKCSAVAHKDGQTQTVKTENIHRFILVVEPKVFKL